MAIAIGIGTPRHGLVKGLVREQFRNAVAYPIRVGSDKPDSSCLYRFGPFCRISHDEHGFTQAGGLFLHSAGIGQDERRPVHQGDKRQVIQGFYQVDIESTGQQTKYWLSDVGIQMHGIDEVRTDEMLSQSGDRLANGLEANAEVLPPMAGNQD
jgi:hypothetical protein